MPIIPFQNHQPKLADNTFIAPDAWIIGRVELANAASVFFGSVLRGDLEPIIVGEGSNIQDHTIIHTTKGLAPTIIEANVTIGHRATLHSCTIKNGATVGMGAIVLDEAEIGEEALVAAGTIVTPRTKVPAGSLIMGNPGKVVRLLSEDEKLQYKKIATRYLGVADSYRKQLA